MSKVYSIVMKVRLDCSICEKKMNKAMCCICGCDLLSKNFNEKENTVTIVGTFDPEKIMKKICQKARKSILGYEVKENVKKEAKALKKESVPPAEPAPKQGKDDDSTGKDGDKNNKKKEDVNKKVSIVVTVPQPPPQGSSKGTKPVSAPKSSAEDQTSEKRSSKPKETEPFSVESKTVATACSGSVMGAPVSWCPCGFCYRALYHGVHEQTPCTYAGYGAQNMNYDQNLNFFSEEDSMCKSM